MAEATALLLDAFFSHAEILLGADDLAEVVDEAARDVLGAFAAVLGVVETVLVALVDVEAFEEVRVAGALSVFLGAEAGVLALDVLPAAFFSCNIRTVAEADVPPVLRVEPPPVVEDFFADDLDVEEAEVFLDGILDAVDLLPDFTLPLEEVFESSSMVLPCILIGPAVTRPPCIRTWTPLIVTHPSA